MAPELRKKKKERDGQVPAAAKATGDKSAQAAKRKATDDASPVASKKPKSTKKAVGDKDVPKEKKSVKKAVEDTAVPKEKKSVKKAVEDTAVPKEKKSGKKAVEDIAVPKEKKSGKKATEDTAVPKEKKSGKKAVEEDTAVPKETKSGKRKKGEREKPARPEEDAGAKKPERDPEVDVEMDQSDEDEYGEADDATDALVETLHGDDEAEQWPAGNTFVKGQDVGTIPTVSSKVRKGAKPPPADKEEPGVIYIGGLPHGFYEHELRAYLGQFGPVTKLRISRSPKTGGSRHYGFVEFEEASTAEIVAKTMDAYLLFGNILRCRVVPKEQQHEKLFRGANRRFKKVPWAKLEGRKLEQPQSELVWTKKIQKENKRRASRAAKLKTLGYEFEAPQLKPAAEALGDSKAAPEPVEQNGHEPEDAQKLIEPEAPATAPTTAVVDAQEDGEAAMPEETKAAEPKKASKGKKTKSRKASRGKGAEETA